jgi:GxxExxY protein
MKRKVTVARNSALTEIDKPFSEEGYALMGAVFEVHKELGGGLLEEIYQECLEIELADRGIPFVAKLPLTTFYKGRRLIKRYVPDLIVHENIVVELKSMNGLVSEHEAQLMNYMRLTKQSVGYLINFAPITKVEWKRIVISDFVQTKQLRQITPILY